MKKITSLELYQAKNKCLELYSDDSTKRLVLNGNSPILLTATILEPNNNDMFEAYSTVSKNSINSSYLDALIMYLHDCYGLNGIIDYLPVENHIIKVASMLSVNRKYNDKEIQNYIYNNNIHALYSLVYGGVVNNDSASINEKTSSYSFMGLTGISKELSKRLETNNLHNHMNFGGCLSATEFNKLGYDFTDDNIAYNDFINIGTAKETPLSQEKTWPRTVELGLKTEEDTYNLERVGGTLIDYFAWVEKELKEKGREYAMSPMRPKTYKKI